MYLGSHSTKIGGKNKCREMLNLQENVNRQAKSEENIVDAGCAYPT
jgi:hypothetical protein